MMTYSIVISTPSGDVDITNKTLSATWDRSLGDASATLDLSCINIEENYCINTIKLYVDGIIHFQGIVKSQSDSKIGITKSTTLKCIDNTDKLQRLLVAEVYENKTAKQILTELMSKYAPWVTINNVQDIGGTIESMVFNYDTLASAIQNLADLSGAYWNLDENNDLHFFLDNEGKAAINYDAANNILLESFNVDSTAMDLTNRVWVIGAKTASGNYVDQYWTGDGVNQIFPIAYVPNFPEVYEDGVLKTIEVEKGQSSSKDYIYDKKNKVLTRVSAPLPAGIQLQFRYRPTVQIIDYFEEPGSVANYGLYEKAIRDRKITDKAAARKRGRAALRKTKEIRRAMNWDTRDWQVGLGKIANISVSSFGINSQARIDSISVTITPVDIIATIEAQEVY